MNAIKTSSYQIAPSLRIWHPRILSAQITKGIGLEPSLVNDVGVPRKTPTGQSLEGTYAKTYWLHKFSIPPETEIELCVFNVLTLLQAKRDFFKKLVESGGRCELFIGVFLNKNMGLEFGPELMGQVANLNLGLSFDVYLPETGRAEHDRS